MGELINKPFKVAAYSGLGLVILWFLNIFLNNIFSLFGDYFFIFYNILYMILFLGLSVLFLYGFVCLGEKFRSNLLVVLGWLGIIFIFISSISSFMIFVGFIDPLDFSEINEEFFINNFLDETGELVFEEVISFFMPFLTFLMILFISFSFYYIFLGIGLLKLSDKVKFAKVAGILNIILGLDFLIFIGFFIGFIMNFGDLSLMLILGALFLIFSISFFIVFLITYIIEIIMFFKLSKEDEGIKEKKLEGKKQKVKN